MLPAMGVGGEWKGEGGNAAFLAEPDVAACEMHCTGRGPQRQLTVCLLESCAKGADWRLGRQSPGRPRVKLCPEAAGFRACAPEVPVRVAAPDEALHTPRGDCSCLATAAAVPTVWATTGGSALMPVLGELHDPEDVNGPFVCFFWWRQAGSGRGGTCRPHCRVTHEAMAA